MRSPIPLVWIALLALVLLPTAAGRVLLDLAGGFVLLMLALPFVLGGVGWIGWKLMQSRMRTCPACGTVNFAPAAVCQMCGTELPSGSGGTPADGASTQRTQEVSVPASSATIDISAEDVD